MIIAITGTHRAGKGVILEYFKQADFKTFSMSGYIWKEVIAQKLPENRNSTNQIGNHFREKFGPEHIAKIGYETALKEGGDWIIEALRCPGEADYLLQQGARLIGIDADPHTRYERSIESGEEKDKRTFEQFMFEENRESTGTEQWDMNIPLCLKKAEIIFYNNSTIVELHSEVRKWHSQAYILL
jgi:dephospho-CoA kinase